MPTRTPEQQIPTTPPTAPIPVAPHSEAGRVLSAEEQRNAELRARAQQLREAPRAVPVSDVSVILGMRTRDGGRQEVVYDVSPQHRILKCTHEVTEKVRAVTEDGQFLGFEPTGEYELIVKVKYLKEG